jgi:mannose-6-phosphate isomerase
VTPGLAWLREEAWPLWLAHGIDRERGGFHEWLDPATLACDATYRRLRVTARQVWTFAKAAEAGLTGAAEAVAMGLDCLARRARRPEGGYATRFDLDWGVTDPRLDTYDNAFCLLAFAATGQKAEAMEVLALFDGPLRHPAGGWREGLPDEGDQPRRQNPHMHLLEALLEAHAAFAEPRCLDLAEEIVGLFAARFLHAPTGTLPEYFDAALAPLRPDGRHAVEPGHHCEWAWLLRRHRRLLDRAGRTAPSWLDGLPERLLAFPRRHGRHPTGGFMMDEVWDDGTPKLASGRLWPQAEWFRGDPGTASAAGLAGHLAGAPPGLWHERRGADGMPLPGTAPASSLYHLTGAMITFS